VAEMEAGSSSGKLVGDAVVWPRTRHLASKGLDEDLHAFPETQHQAKGALLLDVAVSKSAAGSHTLVGAGLVVRGGDLSWPRWRWVPLVGN
jgi:hypothetical protein